MASIKRHASAEWQGSGKDGKGSLTTQSATLKDTPYSFNARFGDGKGTNPEELIAAAHAGCFSMATAFQLSGAGHPPERLHCDAALTMEQEAGRAGRLPRFTLCSAPRCRASTTQNSRNWRRARRRTVRCRRC